MKIRGAVLEESGRNAPYATSVPLTVCDLELDEPGVGEVLVRIEAAGLCHSDLSVVNGSRPRPLPMVLGHEAAGTVLAIGPGVDDIAAGQRVVMAFLPRCGECDACRTNGRLPCTPGSSAAIAGGTSSPTGTIERRLTTAWVANPDTPRWWASSTPSRCNR
jgi:alcohol dehydrogenase